MPLSENLLKPPSESKLFDNEPSELIQKKYLKVSKFY